MSKLGRIIAGQLGGEAPASLADAARELKGRLGSGRAVARHLGVHEKTVRRWLSGETKTAKDADVGQAVRAARAKSANQPVEVGLKYGGRTRPLKLGDGGKLAPGTLDKVKAAYVAGDDDRAARELIVGITDPWYQARFMAAHEGDDSGLDRYNEGFAG